MPPQPRIRPPEPSFRRFPAPPPEIRGRIKVKGKGDMDTLWLRSAPVGPGAAHSLARLHLAAAARVSTASSHRDSFSPRDLGLARLSSLRDGAASPVLGEPAVASGRRRRSSVEPAGHRVGGGSSRTPSQPGTARRHLSDVAMADVWREFEAELQAGGDPRRSDAAGAVVAAISTAATAGHVHFHVAGAAAATHA